mgnify:CR=1 FL=1
MGHPAPPYLRTYLLAHLPTCPLTHQADPQLESMGYPTPPYLRTYLLAHLPTCPLTHQVDSQLESMGHTVPAEGKVPANTQVEMVYMLRDLVHNHISEKHLSTAYAYVPTYTHTCL